MKKLLLATLFVASPCYSQSINTTSQSTGSVVNQAVQVVPARQFTYSSGPSIQCQGATLNISPFLSQTHSFGAPYQPHFDRPIYDTSDNYGKKDEDGNDELSGVAYRALITPLLKGLQDQKKEIDALKAEVAALKS